MKTHMFYIVNKKITPAHKIASKKSIILSEIYKTQLTGSVSESEDFCKKFYNFTCPFI